LLRIKKAILWALTPVVRFHDGKRFVVRADEKLTGFLELETVTGTDDYQNQARTVRRWKAFEAPGVARADP
jgi:hypothetical protein